jgi:hypothetical protein
MRHPVFAGTSRAAAPGCPKRRASKSSLAILERAYRGSLEEQYGHIVWLSRVMKGMGADHALLLKGDTVMFARRDQPRISLAIGDTVVHDVSHYASGVQELLARKATVFFWWPDAERLRLDTHALIEGVLPVCESDMPALISRFDCVWYW